MYAAPTTRPNPYQMSDTELINWWVKGIAPQAQSFHWHTALKFQAFVRKPLSKVTPADLRAFGKALKTKKLKPQTCELALSAVQSLLNYGRRTGVWQAAIPQPPVAKPESKSETFLDRPLQFGLSWSLCVCLFFNLGWVTPRLLGLIPTPPSAASVSKPLPQNDLMKVSQPPQVRKIEAKSEAQHPLPKARTEAFLATIAIAEGPHTPNGYRTQFTGARFANFQDHPRQIKCGRRYGRKLCSDAAGRYQFLSPTWDRLAKKMGIKDFSPRNQDRAAVKLMREKGALKDVESGRFEAAVKKLVPTWPSFRRFGNGSLEKSMPHLKQTYEQKLAFYQ